MAAGLQKGKEKRSKRNLLCDTKCTLCGSDLKYNHSTISLRFTFSAHSDELREGAAYNVCLDLFSVVDWPPSGWSINKYGGGNPERKRETVETVCCGM